MDMKKLMKTALTLSTAGMLIATPTVQAKEQTEKCYGVTKAGKNDCKTSTAGCAGSATKDKQGDAFIFLPKGACEKLVGGSLTPKSTNKKHHKD